MNEDGKMTLAQLIVFLLKYNIQERIELEDGEDGTLLVKFKGLPKEEE